MSQHPDYPEDSKRLAVLKVLTDLLVEQVPMVERRVFRGRYFFTKTNDVPALAILENLDPDRFPTMAGHEDMTGYGSSKEKWILLLQGWVKDDEGQSENDHPTDRAYVLMAHTQKALALINQQTGNPQYEGTNTNKWFRLGGLVMKVTMEPGVARPPQEKVSEFAYFWMRIILDYFEEPRDPFNHGIQPQ